MDNRTRRPAWRQGRRLRVLRLVYKGMDGVGYVNIPSALVGHPTLLPYAMPASIKDIQTLIGIVDRYNARRRPIMDQISHQ